MTESDQTDNILHALSNPEDTTAFVIKGRGSKNFMTGEAPSPSQGLDLFAHTGILDYEPAELMIRARSGVLLTDLIARLAEERQMLPFDPPRINGSGTLGGAVSAGLAGPSRPWHGAVRDAVLGVKMISGQGQLLCFGGQVMKNVAGYDVTRLMVGAWGTFGPLLDVCLKLLPLPEYTETRCFELEQPQALNWLIQAQAQPWPFTGLAWEAGCLRVRLSGREADVRLARGKLGGALGANSYWHELRDARRLPRTHESYCLADLPPATEAHPETLLLDWGGARRWFPGRLMDEVAPWVNARGGHCRLWPGVGLAVTGLSAELQRRLRAVFDPADRCNPHLSG